VLGGSHPVLAEFIFKAAVQRQRPVTSYQSPVTHIWGGIDKKRVYAIVGVSLGASGIFSGNLNS